MGTSLWLLCALLFVDGATLALFTTPLLLLYGRYDAPWKIALLGGLASAAGSTVQILFFRWALDRRHPLLLRFAPARGRLEDALRRHPSASFLALVMARATPLPDAPLKLVAAAARYPLWRYALAVLLGSLPYYYLLALAGRALRIPPWVLITACAVIVLGFGIDRLRRRGDPA